MTKVTLREVVAVAGGGTPRKSVASYYGGGIPWVTPKDMKRPLVGESTITLTDDGVRNSPAKLVPEGSVLVVVRSGVLKHSLPVALTTRPVTVNQDMKALTPVGKLEPSYLARMLKALQPTVLSWVRATTADNFPIDSLLDLTVELPPVPEQRRIAAILDQVDALRAKRRQVLAHLGALPQAIFHDLFGGVTTRSTLRDMGVDFVSGKNVLGEDTSAHPVNRVIKVSAISSGMFISSEVKPMPRDYTPPAAHRLTKGDILFGRASGSLDLLGATAVVDTAPDNLFLPDKVWRLTMEPDASVLPSYVLGVLRSSEARHYIQHNASGAAGVRNIGKAKVLQYSAPLPSIDLQQVFVARVERISQQRSVAQRATAADDELFASLQARAFRGEL